MKKLMLAAVVAVAAWSCDAGLFFLKEGVSGSIDWQAKENYTGGVAPTAGDTVVIPANTQLKVTAGESDFAFVNTLGRVVPRDGAALEVCVEDAEATYDLNCAVSVRKGKALTGDTKGWSETGKLIKSGAGTLRQTLVGALIEVDSESSKFSYNYDFYVNVDVMAGTLKEHEESSSATVIKLYLNVAEGATYFTPLYVASTHFAGWNGYGMITNDSTSKATIYITGNRLCQFHGVVGGRYMRIDSKSTGGQYFLNAKNTFGGSLIVYGGLVTGVGYLGTKSGGASSFGTGSPNFANGGGTVLYLGTGGETSAKPWWTSTGDYDNTIDAGANGGFTLTGKFGIGGGAKAFTSFVLTGDNAQDAVLANEMDQSNVDVGYYFTKRGTGCWRFADVESRGFAGAIAVENGTLKFDSIAEKGIACSLGYATNCFGIGVKYTQMTDANRLPYVFKLGCATSAGTMEYVGSAAAKCSTRPIAVCGKGGKLISSGGTLDFANVFAYGSGETEFGFGSDADGSLITGVSDGTDGGTLSLAKEGSGSAELHGTNTFTGTVKANGGTLTIRNPSGKYKWYKVWITENAYASTEYVNAYDETASAAERSYLQFAEIALYDADGNDLARSVTAQNPIRQFAEDGDYRVMSENEVAYGRVGTIGENKTNGMTTNLFNGAASSVIKCTYSWARGGVYKDKPETWVPFVIRLADDAATVVRVDIAQGYAWNATGECCGRNPTAFRLDASCDGLNWDEDIAHNDETFQLHDSKELPVWFSEPTVISAKINKVRKDKGYVLSQTAATAADLASHNSYAFTGIGAANGGVLTVDGSAMEMSRIEVDAAATSAGTISGFTFAEDGTVNVYNYEATTEDVVLKTALGGIASAANLKNWRVTLNGEHSNRRVVVQDDGTLLLTHYPFTFIVR